MIVEPFPSSLQDVRAVLLTGVRGNFFACDPVAFEKALDRAEAENVAVFGKRPAHLLYRDIGRLLEQ